MIVVIRSPKELAATVRRIAEALPKRDAAHLRDYGDLHQAADVLDGIAATAPSDPALKFLPYYGVKP